jgi:acyl-CoA reductase-like NAD-dependent aldehyde dehydrogenase
MAVQESGLGRVRRQDRQEPPGRRQDPRHRVAASVGLDRGRRPDAGRVAPYGVIGSITPCTNPTETILNNGIGMVAAGNAIVFNTHPAAKKVSAYFIDKLNRAVQSGGGPPTLFNCVAEPTIESAGQLMKHPGIRSSWSPAAARSSRPR